MTGSIESHFDGIICTLTIDNEGKRNAISYPMMKEGTEAISDLDSKPDDYVMIITGARDKAFSAGFDLTQERDSTKEQWWTEFVATIESYDYPTIAMINGDTFGGAVDIIAACDIRIGVAQARFGITPSKIGLVYHPAAIKRIMQIVGVPITKELLFTGNPIDGNRAFEIGLLNHLVELATLEDFTMEMADTISNNAPFSIKSMKWIIHALTDQMSLSRVEMEWGESLRNEAFESRDYREGVEAFQQNRIPEFEGK